MRENDSRMVQKVVDLDAAGVMPEARERANCCGPAGIAAAIASAQVRGANSGHVIEYTDSFHESAGADDAESQAFEMSVGYLGAVLGRSR